MKLADSVYKSKSCCERHNSPKRISWDSKLNILEFEDPIKKVFTGRRFNLLKQRKNLKNIKPTLFNCASDASDTCFGGGSGGGWGGGDFLRQKNH